MAVGSAPGAIWSFCVFYKIKKKIYIQKKGKIEEIAASIDTDNNPDRRRAREKERKKEYLLVQELDLGKIQDTSNSSDDFLSLF